MSCTPREYWMIYLWPGLLAIVWFGSSPTPSSALPPESYLSLSVFLYRRSSLPTGGGGGGGVATSYDGENAWSSINHSILFTLFFFFSGWCGGGGGQNDGD